RGDHGTGKGFRQQAAIVVAEHRQYRTLIAIGHYGLGEACLDCSTGMSHVALHITVVIDHEEIDSGLPRPLWAAIEAQSVHAESIHAETYSALSEAGLIGQYCTLAPFGPVRSTVLVITADIGIAQKQIKAAVFNKAGGICLACSQRRGGGHQSQCDGAKFIFSHLDAMDAVVFSVGPHHRLLTDVTGWSRIIHILKHLPSATKGHIHRALGYPGPALCAVVSARVATSATNRPGRSAWPTTPAG